MKAKIDFAYRDAFIAHAYEDSALIDVLVWQIQGEFEPLRFPSINVEPHEVVSTPIIDAIRNSSALIALDSPRSRDSFWVTFEREFALELDKPVFVYDPSANSLRQLNVSPPFPILMPLGLDKDKGTIDNVLDWAIHERGFGLQVFSANSMSDLDIELTEFDGLFVVFSSRESANHINIDLVDWKAEGRGFPFPRLLLAALDGDPEGWIPATWRKHVFDPRISLIDLTEGGLVRPFSMRRVDDLIVRAHWLLHRLRSTVGRSLYTDDY